MNKIYKRLNKTVSKIIAVSALTLAIATPSYTQELRLGRVTNLPLPRYVSIRGDEAYLRRGPSKDYPIEWVYQRSKLPVRVIGESGHWRKVETPEGDQGWFHYSLLTGNRRALITAERIELREIPSENAQIIAILERGAIGSLLSCGIDWCELSFEDDRDDYSGWVRKTNFWGADKSEVFEPSS